MRNERNEVTFGKFVLDRKAGELHKRGIRLRVPDQSIKVLSLLLERPGDVVTREELCRRLWPNGTIVEFEHGVNNAIRRLRAALEDSAGKPRFIETLPKRGYRFIFPCQLLSQIVTEQTGTRPDDPEDLIGKQFGRYQALEKLGEGATASVYRGFDPRLARFIALKFLAADLLGRPSLRRRFEDEARLASTLNHPNVCTIYDVGDADGRPFIAMELLEGATLERLLKHGALPLPRVLNYAQQIAIALYAAHRREIVHRDVKPGNIFITDRQVVKVTDFGIAQRYGAASGPVLNSPEVLVAGTPGYIAPEHLNGKEAGARGDIFAFGVVLHEMLTGRRPLEREPSVITTLEFGWPSECSKEFRRSLDRILRNSLQNDPQKRYRSAEELLRDLGLAINAFKTKPRPRNPFWLIRRAHRPEPQEGLPDHPSQLGPESPFWVDASSQAVSEPDVRPPANCMDSSSTLPNETAWGSSATRPAHVPRIRIWALQGAAVVLAAAAAIFAIHPPRESSGHTQSSSKVEPLTSSPGNEVQPSLSPDGNQVAFAFRDDRSSNYHIYVKAIGSEEPVPLTAGSADDMSPSWSPDGRKVVFLRFVSNQAALVMVVPSSGGTERELAKILVDRSLMEVRASWSPDGEWIASSEAETSLGPMRLLLISAHTGEKRRLIYEPPAVRGDLSPSFSPDCRYLAYARHISPVVSDIYVLELPKQNQSKTGARRLTNWNRVARNPLWSGNGQEIFFVGEEQRFGRRIWRIPAFRRASARPLNFGEDSTSIAYSPRTNRLVYAKQASSEERNIWRIDVDWAAQAAGHHGGGSPVRLIASTRGDGNAQFSPDGKQIAYQSARSGHEEIWMANNDGSGSQQLTHLDSAISGYPRWSPDSRHLVFHSRPNGYANIYLLDVETRACRPLTSGPTNDSAPSWSHDGKRIYFGSSRQDGSQIWKVPVSGGPATRVTKNSGAVALESVDGKLLFFSKFYEPGLWVLSLDGGAEQQLVPSLYGKDTFAVSKRGIFFVSNAAGGEASINFMSFPFRATLEVARIKSTVGSGLAVSPDEKRILYSERYYTNSDLMLVDKVD
jgi:Tol biopolymer transport system component/DNA-binding winged helix-turn-helix (wHTH) protein/tRNA A-37 threonylcarbamoyl transferase component Bud32